MGETKSGWGRVIKRSLKVIGYLLGAILVLLISVSLLLQSQWGQDILKDQAARFLERRLKTRVSIGSLGIKWLSEIEIRDLVLEDRQQRKLLELGLLHAKLKTLDLISGQLNASEIRVEDLAVRLYRKAGDSTFNFQFIPDAFSSGDAGQSNAKPGTGSPFTYHIGRIDLSRTTFVMQDGWSGTDIDLHLRQLDLRPGRVDPADMKFGLGTVALDSGSLALSTYTGTAPADTASSTGTMPWLDADQLRLTRIDFSYADSSSPFFLHTALGELKIDKVVADLPRKDIRAGKLLLAEHVTGIRTRSTRQAAPTAVAVTTPASSAPYTFSVGAVQVVNTAFTYRDEAGPAGGKNFNAKDLGLSAVNLKADSVAYDGRAYVAAIRNLTGRERSGIALTTFRAHAAYADTVVSLHDMVLRTDKNSLEGDLHLGYASLEALASKPGKAAVDINLKKGVIRLDELLVFAPDLGRNKHVKPLLGRTFLLTTRMKGTVADLSVPSLLLTESGNRVSLAGHVRNLPDMDRLLMDLRMQEIRSSRKDLLALLPKDIISDSLKHFIPERFLIRGTARGTVKDLSADLGLTSSYGDLRLKGDMHDITDPKAARYDLAADLSGFQLGSILPDSTMGPLTATVKAKGRGYDLMTMQAAVQGVVQEFRYRGYGYHDIGVDGSIEAGKLNARIESSDPNLNLAGDLRYDMNRDKGSLFTDLHLRNLDLHRLGFFGDTLTFAADLHIDLPRIDTTHLLGNGLITSLYVGMGERHVRLDSLQFIADNRLDTQFLSLRSRIFNAEANGQFNFKDIPEAARVIANRYVFTESSDTAFAHRVVAAVKVNADLPDSIVRVVPGLLHVSPITGSFNLNTDSSTIGLNLLFPRVEYNGMIVDTSMVLATNVTRNKRFNKLVFAAGTQGVYMSSMHIPKTFAYGSIHRGVFDAKLSQFNEDMKSTKYNLPFVFTNDPARPNLHLGDSLQINGRIWTVNRDNMLYFGGGGMRDSHVAVSRNQEQIRFVTASNSNDGLPMAVEFQDFQLENITNIIKSDSSNLLAGVANGRVELEATSPLALLADLRLDSLALMGNRIGDLHAKAHHTDPDHIAVDLGLQGHGNDVVLAGQLDMKEKRPELRLDMRSLDLAVAEAFTKEYVTGTRGRLKGGLDIKGSFSNPDIVGELRFDSAATIVKLLNMEMRIPEGGLVMSENGITLDKFVILDSAGNPARLEGGLVQRGALDFDANLKLVARNFRFLGPRKFQGQLAYGPARADASINLRGSLAAIQMDGTAKLRDSSLVTYVYTPELATSRGDGLVEFFDPLHVPDSSAILAARKKPALQTAMNLFVTVTPSSTVSVVLDDLTGDALVVKGSSNLNLNKRPGEMINLTGTYTVEDGSYELTIAGLVRKKFKIQKNSTITWTGDVTKANMNIRAVYETRTTAAGLVNDIQSVPGIDKQKLGFKVYLLLTKEILKPAINFELDMDENDKAAYNGVIYNRVKQVNNIPAELNKQVMGLLAINSFIADNPFSSLSGGGSSFGMQAFNTVGGLLTQELNNLVGNLIKGVDISFALDVREDYTSGSAARNTDLKMGLRKSFANNRLAVYVGSSLALENQNQNTNALEGLAGDVTLEYMLTPDGRYRLKGYRINEQVMTFQGTIIKTGLTFVLQIEFGRFKNMFKTNRKD